MTYKNFEDLPVWQDSVQLSVKIFEVTRNQAFKGQGDLANQIQRAGLSIPNNIAEGFERGTTPELLQFLYYAKGSAGEVRSICHVIERIQVFDPLKSQIIDLRSAALSISKQLGAWAFSLQESDIKGSRHLTEKSLQSYKQDKQASRFLTELREQHEKRLHEILEERKKSKS
ncbi:MAG: four helix bundle protein [Kiritimatiellia bacterium]